LQQKAPPEKTSDPNADVPQHEAFKISAGLRLQLESLKTYIPWFIVTITLFQIAVVIGLAALGGVATVGLTSKPVVDGNV